MPQQQTLNGELIEDKDLIKSISYDQDEIIKWIMTLYCPDGFELDPTYSTGNFYDKIPQPKYRFDINPQASGVKQADCTNLPLDNNSIKSIMFDPPFIAGNSRTGIISMRFGSYKNIQTELWDMYHKAIKEFYRILKESGILVVKCQDVIDSSKQYFSHVEIINYAINLGFYPKDLFILLAENRIIGSTHHNQQHARKFHSYFMVFIKQKIPVKYTVSDFNPLNEESLIAVSEKTAITNNNLK